MGNITLTLFLVHSSELFLELIRGKLIPFVCHIFEQNLDINLL